MITHAASRKHYYTVLLDRTLSLPFLKISSYCIFAKRSTAFVKLSMVLSASPCSMPSRTQCRMCPSSTTLPHPLSADLAASVERRPCRVELRENVLAGNIFIHHPVYRLNLPDNFFEPAVQVLGIHTMFHFIASIPLGVYVNYNTRPRRCQEKTVSVGAIEFTYLLYIFDIQQI